ncbi:MAG: hypothetical protein Q7U97_06670 [Rhodocyclaceae bacterium]|nr:hypothetical protein [Rhodocyclaceae bacterium]
MASIELYLVSVLRALVEVALLALLGQGIVAVLAGPRRAANPIYRLFQIITAPVLRVLRRITPRPVLDKHLPLVAFFVLFWLWILLAYVKRVLCGIDGLACGG